MSNAEDQHGSPAARLGTFAGVFTPSILTILGIILFLRLGFVVGSVGLLRALLIVLIANAISVLTSISLSAIATNLRVKGGGDYYLISRTLGVEYGGALGLVLFLAQSVSVAFYAIGFGEAVSAMLGDPAPWTTQAVAAVAVSVLFVLSWLGADWATRFQYVVMGVLFAAIVAFFAGGLPRWDGALLQNNLTGAGELPFWVVFAIFFPAVTGFTQGVSMSGDLRDPGRSLPLGTFAAVGLSLAVYLGMSLVYAATLPNQVTATDYRAMAQVSAVAWLVDAGVIAATLSSALASFLGAPRILQSLAADRVFPLLGLFARGFGRTNNPRRAVALTAALAFITIAGGRLNVIAPVVSMFFLISYGLLNYATYFEARANSPSFRPRFRFFNARLSLAGCLACLAAMLAIHPTAGAVAVALLFAIHQYVARRVGPSRWAAGDRSRRLQRVREDLHAIRAELDHPRDWRPVILAFSNDPDRRERLLRFASWLEGGAGFTTAVRIVQGVGPRARQAQRESESELRSEITRSTRQAFARVVTARDVDSALPVILQTHGLGAVRPNTALLNWPDHKSTDALEMRELGRYLRIVLRYDCNVVMLSAATPNLSSLEATPRKERRIDVWYRDSATGRLMLLLAYLMTRSDDWEDAEIRLLAPAVPDLPAATLRESMRAMLAEVRIDATPVVLSVENAADVLSESAGASLVFLPFRMSREGPDSVLPGKIDRLVSGLRLAALVLATQDIPLDEAPEGGRHGEIAEALDAAERTRKAAKEAEQAARQAEEQVARLVAEFETAGRSAGDGTGQAELQDAIAQTRREVERSRRRAARARAKADSAAARVRELTGEPPEGEAVE